MLLSFTGLIHPVALIGCDELAETIASVLRGWEMREMAQAKPAEPAITIHKIDGRYSRTSRWLSEPASFSDPLNATCDFLVDLMRAYVADNEHLLCLHCAAARFDDGLVIFPSTYKAGKSTLAAWLASTGTRLFTDDVLPIDSVTGDGMAPGFLPRLRLPLPDDAGAEFRAFVDRKAGPGNDRFLYLDLGADALAPLGEPAPIRGAVLLMRDEGAAAELLPAGVDDILQSAIRRNFAHNLSGLDTLDRLHAIVAGAQCHTLRYSHAKDAVAVLEGAFGGRRRSRQAG